MFKKKYVRGPDRLAENTVIYGDHLEPIVYYVVALESSRVTARQMEAARKSISRVLRREPSKAKVKAVPLLSYKTGLTKKSIGMRMGKGKGGISSYIANIRKQDVLFKVLRISRISARSIYKKIYLKLPMKIKVCKYFFNGDDWY
jgi:large subunit ribosomal protein L16